MTSQQFFECIRDDVINNMKESGILASLTAAQAYIESGVGSSKLSQPPNNNLFGMKGAFNGQSVYMNTKEYVNGKYITVKAQFRKYPCWAASIKDHSDLFIRLKRYENLRGEKNYKQACIKVQKDGYATSPSYSDTLIKTIEQYDLFTWDDIVIDPDPELDEAVDVFARRVIEGRFGFGHDNRSLRIYELIRKRVNDILKQ